MSSATRQPVRGEIYMANIGKGLVGSEQAGLRPVLVIQNNADNKHGSTVVVAAITSRNKKPLPVHVALPSYVLGKEVIVLLEQIKTINKNRLRQRIGILDAAAMREIDRVILVSLGVETSFAPGQASITDASPDISAEDRQEEPVAG